jgi:hypothetical protein
MVPMHELKVGMKRSLTHLLSGTLLFAALLCFVDAGHRPPLRIVSLGRVNPYVGLERFKIINQSSQPIDVRSTTQIRKNGEWHSDYTNFNTIFLRADRNSGCSLGRPVEQWWGCVIGFDHLAPNSELERQVIVPSCEGTRWRLSVFYCRHETRSTRMMDALAKPLHIRPSWKREFQINGPESR